MDIVEAKRELTKALKNMRVEFGCGVSSSESDTINVVVANEEAKKRLISEVLNGQDEFFGHHVNVATFAKRDLTSNN